jgi:hypothetical protein
VVKPSYRLHYCLYNKLHLQVLMCYFSQHLFNQLRVVALQPIPNEGVIGTDNRRSIVGIHPLKLRVPE